MRASAILVLGGVAGTLFWTGPAAAASGGGLGPVSSGSVAITLSVAPRFRGLRLSDLDFRRSGGADAAATTGDLCSRGSASPGAYAVIALGAGAGGAFELSGGYRTLPYRVRWAPASRDRRGSGASDWLPPLTAGAPASPPCGEGEAARLVIQMEPDSFRALQSAETYTGTLTLLVSPE